jgi:hypothetical protein
VRQQELIGQLHRGVIPQTDRGDIENIGEDIGPPPVALRWEAAEQGIAPERKTERALRPKRTQVLDQDGDSRGVGNEESVERHLEEGDAEIE